MLNLYGSLTSPYVRHCRIALLEEKIPFKLIPTDYATSAESSPTQRVPYMEDAEMSLTDSSAILHHVRNRVGKTFLPTTNEAELYFLANTAMDTAVNIFLLERDGITNSSYLKRQKNRLASSFCALDKHAQSWSGNWHSDGALRMGCLLSWILFRQRYDFRHLEALVRFEQATRDNLYFNQTQPPEA